MEQILIATPFTGGIDCWNAADWMVILSPVCLILLPILFLFIYRQVRKKKRMLEGSHWGKRDKYEKYKKMEKGFGR